MSQSFLQQTARAALKERQGSGALYDAADAPAEDLLLARRGAAHFARKLNELTDEDLAQQSLCKELTRGQLIADISYRAREMAIELQCIREGISLEKTKWEPDLDLAKSLPARALRHLYTHSSVHLNTEFRDLKKANWNHYVQLGKSSLIPIKSLPYLRARAVWLGAVALNNGSLLKDVPEHLSEKQTNKQVAFQNDEKEKSAFLW